MIRVLAILTTLSFFFQMTVPQTANAVNCASGLERLNWLCSDYQLPVKGFVVECWFSLADRNFSDTKLEEILGVSFNGSSNILADESICTAKRSWSSGQCHLELQLITRNPETAIEYEKRWRTFATRYRIQQPVGATILVEFPEVLNEKAIQELTAELLWSLDATDKEIYRLENGYHAAAYSMQMGEKMQICGQNVNVNFVFRQQENRTMFYLGTPVIYQQY